MFTKYLERGLSVFPLAKNSKIPTKEFSNWQRFCIELPSNKEAEEWDEWWSRGLCNIALALGPASGVMCRDADYPDGDIEMAKLIPPSPVEKFGHKGSSGFFRPCEGLYSHKPSGLDILWTGTYTVLPPSIHPDSRKPYRWTTMDTLENFSVSDLPIIDLSFESDYVIRFEEKYPQKKRGSHKGTGARNETLKAIVGAMLHRGDDFYKIANEIYLEDQKHDTPLFTDKKDQYKAKTEKEARNAAMTFVLSVAKSAFSKGLVEAEPIKEIRSDQEIKVFVPKEYPKARGMMRSFQQLCGARSTGDNQEALSLAGSIAMMAILSSNKFATECAGRITCPNIYLMSLAYSSFGKGIAQEVLSELLEETNLTGSGNYKSDTSLIMNLPSQQEVLIINDESSAYLKNIAGRESYNSSIVELQCELFSKSSTRFHGVATAGHGARYGACWNPHVSFFGCTTPSGFRGSVTREVASKGLMPRFVTFRQLSTGVWDGRKDRRSVKEMQARLQEKVNKFLKIEKIVHPDFSPQVEVKTKNGETISANIEGIRYKPTIIPLTPEALELWYQYDERYFNEKSKNPEGFESAFIGRFAEIALKFALCDALSLDRDKIELDSMQWAFDVVEICWHNSSDVYELAHAENRDESDLIRILTFIKKSKEGYASYRDIQRSHRGIKGKALAEIINVLKESEQIEEVDPKKETGPGRKAKYYRAL